MKRVTLIGVLIGAAALMTACGQSQSTGITQPISASTAQVQTVQTEETDLAAETAEEGMTAGNMVGAENTAAGGTAAPADSVQTLYPTASGDLQQDKDTYYRVKAELDAIDIEISNLEAAYRVGSLDDQSFQSQRAALREQERELDIQEDMLENVVERYYYQTMEIPQGDIQALLDQLSQVDRQKNDQESQERQLKMQYRNGEISREDFVNAMQDSISLEEELDVKEEMLEDSLERLGWDD
ncbi:MAG TPA: hypothetical protein H9716_11510 [Candidatus Enterocloster faecavium]|uniref:SHOCT domain-containing protein n=1 Tax=Candidatus Enterocloster faecavium TaxID=2838560 RepID=A0A9D2L9G0_9FIRM|nr:hypothetical protein [Candidatus Enterocloster faecavium]